MCDGLLLFIASIGATVGFALLFRVPTKAMPIAGLVGGVGYLFYWIITSLLLKDEALAMLIASAIGAFLAEICARRSRHIATVYIIMALIPFVPGLGLYRAMRFIALGDSAQGLAVAVQAMKDILMITLGLVSGSSLFFFIRRLARIKQHTKNP